METFKLVMPENLNHYGFLFGGYMLMWVDEIAWIAASLEYPEHLFVTIGMDTVEFKHGVRQGTILKFVTQKKHVGKTSATFLVEVYKSTDEHPDSVIFSTNVTLVSVDDEGKKKPI
ncbi:MAG: hotdog domain-containing protein [Pirellulaceae bacterium]